MAEMAQIPRKRTAESFTETFCSFGGPVKFAIDWTIRNFSSLKAQTTPLQSDKAVVGASAWSILVYPLSGRGKRDSLIDATTVYVQHDFLGNESTEIRVEYEIW